MNIRLTKIDNDSEYTHEGFRKYVASVNVSTVDGNDYDGLLSMCIDARIPVSQIHKQFKTKEPVSTAGNALFPEIKALDNFTEDNVVITHGLKESSEPKCGGHIVSFSDSSASNDVYKSLIDSLHPYVQNSFNDYDPLLSTRNLAKIWKAPQARFYDHGTGWLYDIDDLYNSHLGVTPTILHAGMNPKIGQNPNLIIINTLGKPFFEISKGHDDHELGGVAEIFYPKPDLTEPIIESLVFCLQAHYQAKNNSGTGPEASQFKNSDTLLLLAKSTEDLQTITKSILSVENNYQKQYIDAYFKDSNDLVLGIVPEVDNKIFEISTNLAFEKQNEDIKRVFR